jgi:hypothetical protein
LFQWHWPQQDDRSQDVEKSEKGSVTDKVRTWAAEAKHLPKVVQMQPPFR